MVADAELVFYQLLHPRPRPEVTQKAEGLGSLLQQCHQTLLVLFGQAGGSPRRRMVLKCLQTPFTGGLEPLTASSLGHPKRLRDLAVLDALLVHLPGHEAPILFGLRA